jgi:hypothetical protein
MSRWRLPVFHRQDAKVSVFRRDSSLYQTAYMSTRRRPVFHRQDAIVSDFREGDCSPCLTAIDLSTRRLPVFQRQDANVSLVLERGLFSQSNRCQSS